MYWLTYYLLTAIGLLTDLLTDPLTNLMTDLLIL